MNETIGLINEDLRGIPEAACVFGIVKEFIEYPELKRIFTKDANYEFNNIEEKVLNINETKTPKIEYDKGKFIYDYECWWTSLETVVRILKKKDQLKEEKEKRFDFFMNAWKRTSDYISNIINYEISKLIKEVDQN